MAMTQPQKAVISHLRRKEIQSETEMATDSGRRKTEQERETVIENYWCAEHAEINVKSK